jgi:hypothetical protein
MESQQDTGSAGILKHAGVMTTFRDRKVGWRSIGHMVFEDHREY